MRARVFFAFAILTSAITGIAQETVQAGSAAVDRMYQTNSEVTFSGKVKGIINTPATANSSTRTSILVRSSNGGDSTVELGPSWFMDHLSKPLKVGDTVSITGSKIFLSGDSVILARKLTRGKQVVYLREVSGYPMWVAFRGRIDVASNKSPDQGTQYTGTISGLSTYSPPSGDPLSIAQVTTPTGIYNLNLGPAWYWQNQQNRFSMGDQISFVGTGVTQLAPGLQVFATNEAIRRGEIFVIGPDLFPIWARPNGR